MYRWILRVPILLAWMVATTPTFGQDGVAADSNRLKARDQPKTYGTSDLISHTIQAYSFQRRLGNPSVVTPTTNFLRYCDGAVCSMLAPLRLPAGSLIESFELEACDEHGSAEITATIGRVEPLDSGGTALATLSTGGQLAPGCNYFSANLSPPETVDNIDHSYLAQVVLFGMNIDTRFQAVRVYYRRQISPAPGTATFNDVPTGHPFFQHIEALAASGITAGCGGGDFCPDQPLTRGQMAVFLAAALGLHWAP